MVSPGRLSVVVRIQPSYREGWVVSTSSTSQRRNAVGTSELLAPTAFCLGEASADQALVSGPSVASLA